VDGKNETKEKGKEGEMLGNLESGKCCLRGFFEFVEFVEFVEFFGLLFGVLEKQCKKKLKKLVY
jgi:hypothetical protein